MGCTSSTKKILSPATAQLKDNNIATLKRHNSNSPALPSNKPIEKAMHSKQQKQKANQKMTEIQQQQQTKIPSIKSNNKISNPTTKQIILMNLDMNQQHFQPLSVSQARLK